MIFWRKVTDQSFENLNILIRRSQAYKVAINLPRLTNWTRINNHIDEKFPCEGSPVIFQRPSEQRESTSIWVNEEKWGLIWVSTTETNIQKASSSGERRSSCPTIRLRPAKKTKKIRDNQQKKEKRKCTIIVNNFACVSIYTPGVLAISVFRLRKVMRNRNESLTERETYAPSVLSTPLRVIAFPPLFCTNVLGITSIAQRRLYKAILPRQWRSLPLHEVLRWQPSL